MVEIAWGARVSAAFKRKVISISEGLGCDPSHLMSAMAFETGERFTPDVRNKVSGATVPKILGKVAEEHGGVGRIVVADCGSADAAPPDLDTYYRDNVIGGPGSFYVTTRNVEGFKESLLKKLVLEIAGPDYREPATTAAER